MSSLVASQNLPDVLGTCKQLRREGRLADAISALQTGLRAGRLETSQLDGAGRLLASAFAELDSIDARRIHIVGQCTTSFLKAPLVAHSWAAGFAAGVSDGDYDSVVPELAQLDAEIDAVVLLPWHRRLLSADDRTHAQRIDDELAHWQQAWSLIPASTRVIQIGYDWIHAGAHGCHLSGRYAGDVRLVRKMNEHLLDALPDTSFFMDLEQISAGMGKRNFYDARNDVWTRQPFSRQGVAELTRHLAAALRTMTVGPKKCLVLDLDNTIWGGVVGELGPHEIELGDSPDGEAFRRFQSLASQLKQRGVLLAVCSKNTPQDAKEPFEVNRDMVLSLDDVAAFEASWDPKPVAIERIAKQLNLGLDSFVFFDDNPAEREVVRQQLPMVEVVDVPDDPAGYVEALQHGLWFESLALTDADRQRADQYCAEQHRRQACDSAASMEEYLDSLEMTAEINTIVDADMKRVCQLLGKTNQFNLTTRRHTEAQVRQMLESDDAIGLTLRLADRFGDYGLVSVVIAIRDHEQPERLRIDTWLMSCRAIGRSVEHHLMNHLVRRASELHYESVLGEYIPTAKNAQVANFFADCGYRPVMREPTDAMVPMDQHFELDLSSYAECKTSVREFSQLDVPGG